MRTDPSLPRLVQSGSFLKGVHVEEPENPQVCLNTENKRKSGPGNGRGVGGRREMSRRSTQSKLQSLDLRDGYAAETDSLLRVQHCRAGVTVFIMRSGN